MKKLISIIFTILICTLMTTTTFADPKEKVVMKKVFLKGPNLDDLPSNLTTNATKYIKDSANNIYYDTNELQISPNVTSLHSLNAYLQREGIQQFFVPAYDEFPFDLANAASSDSSQASLEDPSSTHTTRHKFAIVYTGDFDTEVKANRVSELYQDQLDTDKREYAKTDSSRALELIGYDLLLGDEDLVVGNPNPDDEKKNHFTIEYSPTVVGSARLSAMVCVMDLYKAMRVNEWKVRFFYGEDSSIKLATHPIYKDITSNLFSSEFNSDGICTGEGATWVWATRTVPSMYWTRARHDAIFDGGAHTYTDANYLGSKTSVSFRKNRDESVTMSEFMQMAYAIMNLYGEPVLTQSEIDALLTAYGAYIPSDINAEALEAFKYLAAKGIVDPTTVVLDEEVTFADIEPILVRIYDEGSRLTIKNQAVLSKFLNENNFSPADMYGDTDVEDAGEIIDPENTWYYDTLVEMNDGTTFKLERVGNIDYTKSHEDKFTSSMTGSSEQTVSSNFGKELTAMQNLLVDETAPTINDWTFVGTEKHDIQVPTVSGNDGKLGTPKTYNFYRFHLKKACKDEIEVKYDVQHSDFSDSEINNDPDKLSNDSIKSFKVNLKAVPAIGLKGGVYLMDPVTSKVSNHFTFSDVGFDYTYVDQDREEKAKNTNSGATAEGAPSLIVNDTPSDDPSAGDDSGVPNPVYSEDNTAVKLDLGNPAEKGDKPGNKYVQPAENRKRVKQGTKPDPKSNTDTGTSDTYKAFLTDEQLRILESLGDPITVGDADHDKSKLTYLADYRYVYYIIPLDSYADTFTDPNKHILYNPTKSAAKGLKSTDPGCIDITEAIISASPDAHDIGNIWVPIGQAGADQESISTVTMTDDNYDVVAIIFKTTHKPSYILNHITIGSKAYVSSKAVQGFYRADDGTYLVDADYLQKQKLIQGYRKLSEGKYVLYTNKFGATNIVVSNAGNQRYIIIGNTYYNPDPDDVILTTYNNKLYINPVALTGWTKPKKVLTLWGTILPLTNKLVTNIRLKLKVTKCTVINPYPESTYHVGYVSAVQGNQIHRGISAMINNPFANYLVVMNGGFKKNNDKWQTDCDHLYVWYPKTMQIASNKLEVVANEDAAKETLRKETGINLSDIDTSLYVLQMYTLTRDVNNTSHNEPDGGCRYVAATVDTNLGSYVYSAGYIFETIKTTNYNTALEDYYKTINQDDHIAVPIALLNKKRAVSLLVNQYKIGTEGEPITIGKGPDFSDPDKNTLLQVKIDSNKKVTYADTTDSVDMKELNIIPAPAGIFRTLNLGVSGRVDQIKNNMYFGTSKARYDDGNIYIGEKQLNIGRAATAYMTYYAPSSSVYLLPFRLAASGNPPEEETVSGNDGGGGGGSTSMNDLLYNGFTYEINKPEWLVDWEKFDYDRMVSHLDDWTSILLFAVMSILPRIALLLFFVLMLLSLIVEVRPWRMFCERVFDVYSFLTFGRANVNTVNLKSLFITSMIGFALMLLIVDGTFFKVIIWFCETFLNLMQR